MRHTPLRIAAAAAAACIAGSAFAAASALPDVRMQGSIPYLTGGVGKIESQAMKRETSRYPLSLVFVENAGSRAEYLADIDVTIKDRMGNTELQVTSDGPYLLAKLPDGRYSVTADYEGMVKTRQVIVDADNPRKVVFAW